MTSKFDFSLNRIACPSLSLRDFLETAKKCGIKYVELRNDLPGGKVIDSHTPAEAAAMFKNSGISPATVNAIQKFNLPSNFAAAREEIRLMAELCSSIGCRAIVLCPNNDTEDKRSSADFLNDTAEALSLYAPLFSEYNITGLIEPLGFGECSIRGKKTAVEAIALSGETSLYRIVHDTFHHYLGTDSRYFHVVTGLVHVSGVEALIADSGMRDSHRILVTEKDRIKNLEQLKELYSGGYRGIVSFEPFSEEVQMLDADKLVNEIRKSIEILASAAN